jgi:hypothetical protein
VKADGPLEVKLGHQAAVVTCIKHENNQNKPQAKLEIYFKKTGIFYFISMYYIQHCFICRPTDFTVSEDAGIEPRTVATFDIGSQKL